MKTIDKIYVAYVLFCLALMACISWALMQKYRYGGNPYEEQIEETVEVNQDVINLVIYVHEVGKQEISTERVLTLLDTLNVEHSHIVFAQMRLESGNFKSDLAKNNDNFFGMKYPRQRATVAQGMDRGYAYYRSWSYSVLDYAIWQRRYASGLTEEEYLEMLSEKYAEDKAYVRKVKSIADSIKVE
jgi:hypothetical protein